MSRIDQMAVATPMGIMLDCEVTKKRSDSVYTVVVERMSFGFPHDIYMTLDSLCYVF